MFTIDTLPHIRAYQPDQTLEFESVGEARAKLNELGRDFVPASLHRPDGSTLATNYPNPFAGTIDRREKAEALYNARDPEWVKYSSTF